ncbi:GGDEF domain-containing protein [Denitromonas sp.]|uniref:GGDEF domain-containing protein n=1 Tax=Denitromonas sp. TaxID=2734609 RepID=UPI003A84398A
MSLPPLPDALDTLESLVIAEFDAYAVLRYGNAGLRRLLSDQDTGAWQLFAAPMLDRVTLPATGTCICFEGLITVNGPGNRVSSLRGRIDADAHRLRVIAGYELDDILSATDTLMALNAALVATQRELARSEATVRRLSLTDPLTGVANRQALDTHTIETLTHCEETDTPVWLILVDIDHFKQLNDRWGHDAGDMALTAVATALDSHCRDGDFVARFGGAEFVILPPALSRQAVAVYAERLRKLVAALELPPLDRISTSFGIARRRPGDTGRALFARADAALYRAKAQGRNCVVFADAAAPTHPWRPA